MTLSYIALGSNLQQPLAQVTNAIEEIDKLAQCRVLQRSPWYQSVAVGPGRQPDYVNGVVRVATGLTAEQLLDALQAIENLHQRTRAQRWGARTLDLDILLFGAATINSQRLTIPHPALAQRNFVLQPLFDLAPALTLPCGTPIASLLARLGGQGLKKLPVAGKSSASGDISDTG